MGVAADDDVGIRALRDPRERRVRLVLVEVFVDPSRAAVDEKESPAVGLESDIARERPERRFVGVGRVLFGPFERSVAKRFLGRVDIRAASSRSNPVPSS
jgi:hypothetical protein